MKIEDIALAIKEDLRHEIVGIRPGEKLHEEMISASDCHQTYEYEDYFRIFQQPGVTIILPQRKIWGY